MKKLLGTTLIIIFFVSVNLSSQIPDDDDGRLYRLCKIWGYQKYFSEFRDHVSWDSLLTDAIEKTLVSENNIQFNNILFEMLSSVANNTEREAIWEMPDTNFNLDLAWLEDEYYSEDVKDYLTTFSNNFIPDTCTGLIKSSSGGIINFTQEMNRIIIGKEWSYQNESHRLNIFFFFWNIINYYYPYKNLMDNDWDDVLMEFIPKFREVNKNKDYHIMFLKLVSRLNDSHGYVLSNELEMFWKGEDVPKIYFSRAEGKCVATKISDEYQEIKPGDILLKIKDDFVDSLEAEYRELIPASNDAAFYRDYYWSMMLGYEDTYIDLTLLDKNGNEYTQRVYRNFSGDLFEWMQDNGREEGYYITDCGYGYLNMLKLSADELPAMWELLKDTPALIIDLRHYTWVNLSDLLPYFFDEPITSAISYMPAAASSNGEYHHCPGWFYTWKDTENFEPWIPRETYQGEIKILVNEFTQSYLEYDCQYLSFHPNAKVYGTQSAGADGNVKFLNLPGGLRVQWTGLGWYYADGYQQQRNGVRIDSLVTPTIDCIRRELDEVLIAALDCISDVETESEESFVEIFPNPAGDYIEIENLTPYPSPKERGVRVEVFDVLGQSVLRNTPSSLRDATTLLEGNYRLDVSHLQPGIYFVRVNNEFYKFVKM